MADGNANDAGAYGAGSGPHPAFRNLDRLIGTREKSDPSEAGTVDGRSSFEWIADGHFLLQRVDFTEAKGIEVIGHDEESGSLRSQYFGNGGGILEYAYELEGDTLTGRREWTRDGEEMAHDAVMTRVGDR